MPAMKLGITVGGLALLLGMTTSAADAQAARRDPPMIRIYSDNGVDYVGTTTYITPRIELSENAYVFAVEMDMDGQIQVLHPDMPGISVRISAHRSLQLPNFFVGFNSSRYGRTGYVNADRGYYDAYGADDSRGTAIALASRAPFNLEKIESAGDWDLTAIRHLIENRSPLSAAEALAEYLGQAGEPIGRDFLRFEGAGASTYPYYAAYGYNYYSPCSAYLSYTLLPNYVYRPFQAAALFGRFGRFDRGRAQLIGYDACGLPIYTSGFVVSGPQTPIGHFPPRTRGDTTIFPKSRLPQTPVHRGSTVFANTLEEGMPVTRPGVMSRTSDVDVKAAPMGRRAEPRQHVEDYGGGMAVPQGRIPVERVIVPRAETSAGARVVPQYRPEPRVEATPARMPERTYSPPPPVIHERPSAPPPPPRETPTTRSEPPRIPPPARGH